MGFNGNDIMDWTCGNLYVSTLTNYAKMIFCLNELPKTNDISNDFYRRFLIALFNVQIPKSRINPNLAKDIISRELPGVMNWVLEGRERVTRNGKFQTLR